MLIQKIINAKDFDSHKRYKVGSIVIFENGYYINFSGRNSNPDTPEDWLYIGEKDKFSSFASVDASNDINVQNWRTKLQIPDMVADDFLEKIVYNFYKIDDNPKTKALCFVCLNNQKNCFFLHFSNINLNWV